MPTDVFISHSSTDKQMADTICAHLESKGVSCWIAPRNILPGEEWGDSILRGIQTCQIMVLIFSKAANDSGPVRSEVDRAVNARKVLIPFRIENVAPTGAMEFHIGRRHWLEAYSPPIDRHLELLAHAVHDILHPPAPATPSAAPSATLASENTVMPSTARRPESVLLPRVTQDDVPLRVLLNFNHVVVAGHPSTFQIIVENTSASPLKQIEILMESRGLEQPARKTFPKLVPAQSQRHLFEIEPIRSGNFALQCTIKCQEDVKQIALVGSRSLRINETPATSNITLDAKNFRGNAGETATSGGSSLGNLVPTGAIHSLNDLLNLELEENFEPLELSLDYQVSMRALAQEEAGARYRLQIPGSFLNQGQEGTLLKLEPASSGQIEIRLLARSSFSLGRSREDADFLTWFWPRNEANDQKTRRVSKKHSILAVHGMKIHVRDNETANHTALGGQDLTAKDGEPLERRGILKIANVYSLDVTPFPSNTPEGPTIANIRNWSGEQKESAATTVRGSVRFIPMTPQVLPQNAVWLLSDGAFGTSRANPIIVDVKGLAEIQGRFYHHLGCFWLESSVDNGAVYVNGARLEPGFIVPLVTGQTIKLGEASFRVTVAV
jgi:hypothetical protein